MRLRQLLLLALVIVFGGPLLVVETAVAVPNTFFYVDSLVWTGVPCCFDVYLRQNTQVYAQPLLTVTMEVLAPYVTVTASGPSGAPYPALVTTVYSSVTVTFYMPLPDGLKAGPQVVNVCFTGMLSSGVDVRFTAYTASGDPYYDWAQPFHQWPYTSDLHTLGMNGECSCILPPKNMSLWLPFDELGTPAKVKNLRGLNGTVYGNPIGTWNAEVKNALIFNGIYDYVLVPNYGGINIPAAVIGAPTGDFSIDAWIRRDGLTGVRAIVDKRTYVSGILTGYTFYLYGGRVGIQIADGPGGYVGYNTPAGVSEIPITSNPYEWHHVAVTVDRDNTSGVVFYVDGQQVGPAWNPTGHLGSLVNSSQLMIGERLVSPQGGAAFCGGIDELEIYRRVLPPAEVEAIYQAEHYGKCKKTVFGPVGPVLCDTAPSATALTTTIINSSVTDETYNYRFANLPYGTASDTLVFSPASGTIIVGAGSCAVINNQVQLPGGMTPNQSAFYGIFVNDSLLTHECVSSLSLGANWCARFPHGFVEARTDTFVDLGPISVTNLGSALDTLRYWCGLDTDTHDVRIFGDGCFFVDTVVIGPGATIGIPLAAKFVDYSPMYPYRLTFAQQDTTNAGEAVNFILASMVFMNKSDNCCAGTTGNIDGDESDVTDISDLSAMVDYLFFGGAISSCAEENDVDSSGAVDISDLSLLVDFLFFGGALPTCP